ncbi:cytochrome c oxidase subunit 1 [Dissophora ornata]|nr:cytochrome c oxidase subunit 1 [Dissophora ornata]
MPAAQPCIYWNENDILYEPGVDGALVTTRTQITQYGPFTNQTEQQSAGTPSRCDVNVPTVPECDLNKAPSTLLLPTSIVADIERFTLMLEHSIRGQATGLQMRSGNMVSGLLRDSETGQVVKTFADQSRFVPVANASVPSGTTTAAVHLAGDVMTVGEFLKASGIDLDELSRTPTAVAGETVRSSGVVVIVVIQYAAKGWNPNLISYEYLPKAIHDQEYKVIETIRDFRDGNRVEINRHGIRIVFSQTGQLGQFSFMTLLTNLVAAIALFKVANIIVELTMLRLHPQKKVYVRAKFESTNDPNTRKKDGALAADLLAERSIHMQDHTQIDNEMELSPTSNALGHSKYRAQESYCGNGIRFQSQDARDGQTCLEECEKYDDGESDSEKSESEVLGTLEVSQREARYGAESGAVSRRPSGLHLRNRIHAANMANSSKDSHRQRPKTPVSGYDNTANADDGGNLSFVGWNKNESRFSLSCDATPGVASSRPGGVRHGRSSDDFEIETQSGPLRLNSFNGFNPEGFFISGASSQSSNTSQIRLSINNARGMATPRYQTRANTSSSVTQNEPLPTSRSLPAMQLASPSPVSFGPPNGGQRDSISRITKGHQKSRRHTVSKQRESPSTKNGIVTLTPSSSSGSFSSVASSSSSPSWSPSCEDLVCSVGDELRSSTAINFGKGLNLPSTLSFGTSGEIILGQLSLSGRPHLPESVSNTASKYEYKKRGKEPRPTNKNNSMSVSSVLQSASSEIAADARMRSMFSLGASSNMSSLSLSHMSSSLSKGTDVKGKQPDHARFSSSSKSESIGVFTTTSHLPIPAVLTSESDLKLEMDGIVCGWGSNSSSSSFSSSSSSFEKQPQRSGIYQTFHPSISSPDLLNGGCCSTPSAPQPLSPSVSFNTFLPDMTQECSQVLILEGYPDSYTMSCTDLPPRESDWRYPTPPLCEAESSTVATATDAMSGYSDHPGSSAMAVTSGGGAAMPRRPCEPKCRRHSAPQCPLGSVGHFTPAPPVIERTEEENEEESAAAGTSRHGSSSSMAESSYLGIFPFSPSPATTPSPTNGYPVSFDVHGNPGNRGSTNVRTHMSMTMSTTTTSYNSNSNNRDNNCNNNDYYADPMSNMFTSPITSSCSATLAGSGVRVLRRTISIITADGRTLQLRRGEPLVLNDDVGKERAARM